MEVICLRRRRGPWKLWRGKQMLFGCHMPKTQHQIPRKKAAARVLLYPVLGDNRGEQVWLLGGVKQGTFVLPLTYQIDQHWIVFILISVSLHELCVLPSKKELSLFCDVWITPSGDNRKHNYITSQTQVFFPAWLHARKASHKHCEQWDENTGTNCMQLA